MERLVAMAIANNTPVIEVYQSGRCSFRVLFQKKDGRLVEKKTMAKGCGYNKLESALDHLLNNGNSSGSARTTLDSAARALGHEGPVFVWFS